jgi:rhombotail lipoprotein
MSALDSRARRALPAFALVVSTLAASACASGGGPAARRSSSVVSYLASSPAEGSAPAPVKSVLRLPLRVAIAFVPAVSDGVSRTHDELFAASDRMVLMEKVREHFAARPWVGSIQIVPDQYMQLRGGFENLDQLRRLLGVDVIALLSYDQVQFTDDTRLSLTYLTIAGAYLVNGQKNDTRTMLDAAIFDVASRRMLFRAAGESHVRAGATAVNVNQRRRDDAQRGFREAADDLVTKLDAELERFAARVREPNADVTMVQPDSAAHVPRAPAPR